MAIRLKRKKGARVKGARRRVAALKVSLGKTVIRRKDGPIVALPNIARPIGGHLALDFCNTAGEHLAERPDEMLRGWEAFILWAVQAGLIGPESYAELRRRPAPVEPIVRLREAISRVGRAVAGQRPVRRADSYRGNLRRDVDWIRREAKVERPAIDFRGEVLRWRPRASRASAELRSVLANEALSLFCSPKVGRIGMCEGGKCGWLFLDESRGKRRRWCDMNDCGNRAKARAFYERHK